MKEEENLRMSHTAGGIVSSGFVLQSDNCFTFFNNY